MTMKKLTRSRTFGVGLMTPGYIHIHSKYATKNRLKSSLFDRIEIYKKSIQKHLSQPGIDPNDIVLDFNILKISLQEKNITFIKSPDFDTAHEPVVGDWITVGERGVVKTGTTYDLRYLHKWLMVRDDYENFDIQFAELRSADILKLEGLPNSNIVNADVWSKDFEPLLEKTSLV